jgi:uncharacterized protein involved in exopolysaccharide biosynthesis
LQLTRAITGHSDSFKYYAQLIADSEARAVVEIAMVAAASADRNVSLRLERDQLRAEVERLKADGAASAFVNMASRASRAETDRNNLRADLDAIKAILNEETNRAERAEAELADERARLDAVVANCWAVHSGGSSFSVFSNVCGEYIATAQTYRAAIDAAMKEDGA